METNTIDYNPQHNIVPIYLPSVFPCGTFVETKLARIVGMITAVTDRFNQHKYEVSYFLQGKQEVIWMDAKEFDVVTDTPGRVGFNQ